MESKITYDEHGNARSFTGEAQHVFNAACLRRELGLHAVGLKPHRNWKLKPALATASYYTGEKYSSKKDIERARADLSAFVQTEKERLS